MTWARLDDTFVDDPDLLRLPRGVRLLHVEGIVWSCKHLTDGRIERHVLRRLSDEPELDDALRQLVEAGLWEEAEDGYRIAGFLATQPSREAVEARRADTALRKQRSQQHYAGDHSLCIRGRFCSEGAVIRTGTGSGTRSGLRSGTDTRPVPPDPSRPKGKGREEERSAAPRSSPGEVSELRPRRPDECSFHRLEQPCRGCAADAKAAP